LLQAAFPDNEILLHRADASVELARRSNTVDQIAITFEISPEGFIEASVGQNTTPESITDTGTGLLQTGALAVGVLSGDGLVLALSIGVMLWLNRERLRSWGWLPKTTGPKWWWSAWRKQEWARVQAQRAEAARGREQLAKLREEAYQRNLSESRTNIEDGDRWRDKGEVIGALSSYVDVLSTWRTFTPVGRQRRALRIHIRMEFLIQGLQRSRAVTRRFSF